MFKPHRIALAALFLSPIAITSAPAFAQDIERMEQTIQSEADGGTFMGAVLVARGDEVLLSDAWGSADLEWGIENTPQTKFRIGSVTKQFTAVLIMLLQEEGKLDLDDPISMHLNDTPESWANITIRQLIRHTSGIPSFTSLESFGNDKYLPLTPDEVIARFRDLPLDFEPDSEWSYSNSGYILLSRIVENASGVSFEEALRTRLLDPLGMKDTGIDVSAKILPKRAAGYSPDENGIVNADFLYMGIPGGAGAMYSTTGDLMRWQRGLYEGKVLSPESFAEFVTPAPFDALMKGKYAHGIAVISNEEGLTFAHSGGIDGFNAWLSYDPDRDISVVVLTNLNGGAASKLGNQLMTLARGGDVTLPSERVASEATDIDFAQYEGVYALSPNFKITMFVKDGTLMTQATGQDAFELFHESDDRFFLKVVDAQVRFDRNEEGDITGITLFQGGAEMPGTKE